jgi:hypothetical protein
MRVRSDRAAKGGVLAVSKANSIASAQAHDL